MSKEPLRKRFANFTYETFTGTGLGLAFLMVMPVMGGLGVYDICRSFEASEWDSQTIGNRDKALKTFQDQFNDLQKRKDTLMGGDDSRKSFYGQGIDDLRQARKQKGNLGKKLRHDTTIYAKNLITSKEINESDYYELGQGFLEAEFNNYSSIKINANYFEASNRMECHLDLDLNDGFASDAGYINDCMERKARNGTNGENSETAGVLFGIFVLLGGTVISTLILDGWKELPNEPSRNGFFRRKKMKEN